MSMRNISQSFRSGNERDPQIGAARRDSAYSKEERGSIAMENKSKAILAAPSAAVTVIAAQQTSTPADTRKQTYKTGVVGGTMTDIERNVPLDEPPPLPP